MKKLSHPPRPLSVRNVSGQASWVVANGGVEMAVTKLGGQMAPVTFGKGADAVSPYYVSPWQGEGGAMPCPVLIPLRGDFFCLPFGGNGTPCNGEKHPPHGETAGSLWKLEGCELRGGVTTLSISLEPQARPGKVTRHLSLVEGQSVVYSRTVVEGFAGPATYAHHAILRLPEQERSVLVSTSPFKFGMTYPGLFSDPKNREYQSLAKFATFSRLDKVPSIFKDTPYADCSAFPTRYGYADLIQLFEDPAESAKTPAWVTVVNTVEHWLWFAFKSPEKMPGRILWMENHGRHGPPWNGRNACLGIEDGCCYFDVGVTEASRPNRVSERGVRTSVTLDGKEPFDVRYIQGGVRVPPEFGKVAKVEFRGGKAVFADAKGNTAATPVTLEFLSGVNP